MKTKFWITAAAALILQIVVFNGLGSFVRYIPYLGLWGVVFYPPSRNNTLYLLVAFLLGLTLDLSMGTGGIFAGASLVYAFFRPLWLQWIVPDYFDNPSDFAFWEANRIFLYSLAGNLLLTVFIYFFDSLSMGRLVADLHHIWRHGLLNFFFLTLYTYLFYWNNLYKLRQP